MSIENIVIGILIVVGLGFTTLIMQYFTATQATFQDLKDQVVEQNAKIDALTKVLELQTTQPSPQK